MTVGSAMGVKGRNEIPFNQWESRKHLEGHWPPPAHMESALQFASGHVGSGAHTHSSPGHYQLHTQICSSPGVGVGWSWRSGTIPCIFVSRRGWRWGFKKIDIPMRASSQQLQSPSPDLEGDTGWWPPAKSGLGGEGGGAGAPGGGLCNSGATPADSGSAGAS